MPNETNFSASTAGAHVNGTLRDSLPVIPNVPPMGLQAIGPRVTFNFAGLWDAETDYEYYDVVRDAAGNSYIGRVARIPAGTALTNEDYWIHWADPNAQVEALATVVDTFADGIADASAAAAEAQETAENANETATAANEAIEDKTSLQNSLVLGANNAPWRALQAFASFIPHLNEFHYGNNSLLKYEMNSENEFVPADIPGTYVGDDKTVGTSCAPTVMMAFMNIYYETCRLATGGQWSTGQTPILSGGINYPAGGGGSLDILNPTIYNKYSQESDHVMYASFFAKMLNDAGMLHKRHNFDNISEFHVGDILFWSDGSANTWEHIHHTGIYLGPWSTGGMIADTSSSRLYAIRNASLSTLQDVKYYATVPCTASDAPVNLLAGKFPTSVSPDGWIYDNVASADITGHYLELPAPMTTNNIYTAVFKLDNIMSANVRLSFGARDTINNVTNQNLVTGNLNVTNPASYLGNGYYYAQVRTGSDFGTFIPNAFFFRPFTDSDNLTLSIKNVILFDRMCQPTQPYNAI